MASNKTKAGGKQRQHTVKIDIASHEKLKSLIAGINSNGWAAVGNGDRNDTATIANVIDEAVTVLLAKLGGAARRVA